jgi:hypothetical protein
MKKRSQHDEDDIQSSDLQSKLKDKFTWAVKRKLIDNGYTVYQVNSPQIEKLIDDAFYEEKGIDFPESVRHTDKAVKSVLEKLQNQSGSAKIVDINPNIANLKRR